jgi:chromosome partitioning protein
MKAKSISLIHQKGGCGKSTASIMLASELAKRGIAVLLVDADSQGTSSTWAKAAPDNAPFPVPVMNLSSYAEKIHREIQQQLNNYQVIVVDCGPSLEALAPLSALLVSNLAIIPLPPSPADLWAARGARALIERAQLINEGLRAAILP